MLELLGVFDANVSNYELNVMNVYFPNVQMFENDRVPRILLVFRNEVELGDCSRFSRQNYIFSLYIAFVYARIRVDKIREPK